MLLMAGCGPSHDRGAAAESPRTTASAPDSARGWRAATFQGVRVGTSREAEMLRRLGTPRHRTRVHWSDSVVVWSYEFPQGGELPGRVVVDVDTATRVVLSVALHPDRLSVSAAIRHFGPGFQRTRYGRDECLGDAESTPLYEDPDGPVEYVEYRTRGIAIPVEAGDTVREIYYRDGTPLGAAAPAACARSPAS
jgi:hypothetical protein